MLLRGNEYSACIGEKEQLLTEGLNSRNGLQFQYRDRKDVGMPRRISPLELFHPDGFTKSSFVIGSNCPAVLLPKSRGGIDEHVDLFLLAPSVEECRTSGWFEQAVERLAQRLTPDGFAYVVVPLRWRRRITTLLRYQGLTLDTSLVHIPDLESSRYLVPLDVKPARYALSRLIPGFSWRRDLAKIGFRLRGGKEILRRLLPSIGIVARRPGTRPLFSWLFELQSDVQRAGSVVISLGWRRQNSQVVLHCFSDRDMEPLAVAKIALTTTSTVNLEHEAEALTRLGVSARIAGAQVPQIKELKQIDGNAVLLETVVHGKLLADLFARRPDSLLRHIEHLAAWLERWNQSTITTKPLDSVQLARDILAPAALLAPLLENGKEYQDWLIERCAKLAGIPVPLVATHNDLTMYNVLLDGHGQLGVVDWDKGREEGLPLVDFFYALTDAVAATQGYVDRPRAFEACFAPAGRYAHVAGPLLKRLIKVIGIPVEVADLCFHACWLHHAANEHHSSVPSDSRPFLQILQYLALYRPSINRLISE